MGTHNTSAIALPALDYIPCDPQVVKQYIHERSHKEQLRDKVMARFDKILNQAVELGCRRIKGMSISAATKKGFELIREADFMWLLELKNVRRQSFLSILFDTVNKP